MSASAHIDSCFIKVGALIQLELIEVNDVAQTFDMDFGLICQWMIPPKQQQHHHHQQQQQHVDNDDYDD